MLIEQLQQLSNVFTKRFFFNALLPSFVFGSLTSAALLFSTADWPKVSQWWQKLDVLTKFIVALGYLAFIWFIASAVASQWRGIVRLYEGYPLRELSRRLGRQAIGVRWHQDQLETMRHGGLAAEFYRYPPPDYSQELLPTRIGNILLAAEKYPLDRYSADAIIFWPRLFPLLPEQFQRDYEEAVITYQFPLVVSFLSALAGVISGGSFLLTGQSPLLFLLVSAAGILLSYGAYVFALAPAEELGEQLRTAFDLYRDRLLEAWPTVADIRDEKAAFEEITFFVLANVPPNNRWEEAQTAHGLRRLPAATQQESGAN